MKTVSAEHIREYLAKGFWTERTLVEDFRAAVARHPEREALADPPNRGSIVAGAPRRLSWGEVGRAVTRCALAFDARGLRKDDVLVVQLPNIVEQVVAYLAAMRLGIVITPVAVQFREYELTHVVSLTGAKAVLTASTIGQTQHPELFRKLPVEVWSIDEHVDWFDGAAGATGADVEHEATLERIERAAGVTAHDVVTICWTSGTEGVPKGVPRNHNEWRIVAEGVARSVKLEEGTRLLNPFPLVNLGGIAGLFCPWLILGGTLIQHHPFALPVFLEQLRTERPDYTVVPPALLNAMLQNPALLAGVDLARMRRIGSGSAPLSEWMVTGFAERGVQIVNYFGSNEGCTLMSVPEDLPDPALRATYFPRFGDPRFEWSHPVAHALEARLWDTEANEAVETAGRVGELQIRGPTVFSGYYRSPELNTRAFDAEGYFRTGDLFQLAGERLELFRFVGRSKDIIVRGGTKISSEELETLLLEHPDVADVAVIGTTDARLGEKVMVVAVAKANHEVRLDSVVAFLRDEKKVAVYKLPERLEVVPSLPRNPVGKLLKRELRGRFG